MFLSEKKMEVRNIIPRKVRKNNNLFSVISIKYQNTSKVLKTVLDLIHVLQSKGPKVQYSTNHIYSEHSLVLTPKHVIYQRVHPPHFLLVLETNRSGWCAEETACLGDVAHRPGYRFDGLDRVLFYSPWFARQGLRFRNDVPVVQFHGFFFAHACVQHGSRIED